MRCQPSRPTKIANSFCKRELVCEVRARANVDLPEAGIPAMPTRRREEFDLTKLDGLVGLAVSLRYIRLEFCNEELCEEACLLVHPNGLHKVCVTFKTKSSGSPGHSLACTM